MAKKSKAPAREEVDVSRPPANREELSAWVKAHVGVEIPGAALIVGHEPPLDYLAHTFFEGRRSLGGERAGATDAVVWASRGGGKTFLGAVATLLDMIFKPGIEIRVLGGSYEQSRRMHVHLTRLLDSPRRPELAALVKGRITERRVRLINGSEVELLAQSQTSVRGTRVQKLRCDEVELFDREVWRAAQLVTRSGTFGAFEVPGSVECLSTMHLPHGLMHELVEECRAGKRRLLRWGVVDVLGACGPERACETCALHPECAGKAKARGGAAGHVAVEDALGMKGRVSVATWRSEMLCERPTRSDAVLPEFDPAVHVFRGDAPAGERLWIAGMDFGFRAPTVVVYACVDEAGAVWVTDERSERETLLAEHIAAIREGRGRREERWPAPVWIGVDPAGRARNEQTGKSHIDLMKQAGLSVRQRAMPIQAGLELLRARLRPAGTRARLFVHERCRVLIESLERYRYPTEAPESLVPVKGEGFDHAVDALRYMIQNLDHPVRLSVGNYLKK